MRSAAEGEHRTGEDVGEAVPLMPLEAIQPFGKGEVKGNARRACPRSQSGKNRRGMQPKRLPKRSAERSPAGDGLARSRQILCRQKETPPKRGLGVT